MIAGKHREQARSEFFADGLRPRGSRRPGALRRLQRSTRRGRTRRGRSCCPCDDLLVRQPDETVGGVDAVNLAAGVAVDRDEHRRHRFADGDIETILRRRGRAAACRLEDQFVADALTDAARDRRNIDRGKPFVDGGAIDQCRP